MRGYLIDVVLRQPAPEGEVGVAVDLFENDLLLNLYDNGEKVLSDIGALSFELLTPIVYVGVHIIEVSYYHKDFPEQESAKVEIYRENFTLNPLTITATVEILS